MDVAKALVRCVVRAFYDVKHVLIIDALMIHNALRDDDLGYLLGLQTKDLHKLCGKLKEDRLLHVHTRLEPKENQQRPVNRTYYYVDFRATIDAVKYRMHKVVKDVERKMNKDADTKGYVCPRCNKQFGPLDIVTLIATPMGFECDRCSTELVDDDDSAEVKTSQERLGRLMDQLKPVIDLLKKIDEVVVPQNEFEDALRSSIPVPRVKNLLTGATVPGGYIGGPGSNAESDVPYAKGGINNTAAAPLEVTFTSSDEKTAQEKAAEAAKRSAQMEQNALPVWHTQSTVSGEITKLGLKEAAARREREGFTGKAAAAVEETKKPSEETGVQVDAIQQYYAAMAAQQAREQAEEEEEEEEEEEDEDEFEDIVATSSTTPMASAPAAAPSAASKKDAEDSDSSSSSTSRPSGVALSQPGNGPPTKKVKIQSPAPVTAGRDDDDDDDDEDEFEDAI
ncbi:TFIIE alpha subunit-domain-containing protein [Kalaharituber pfeilii]|nr:TFIIE alpha subunit-domain-containing protein [Kalaharituber pfeilii]